MTNAYHEEVDRNKAFRHSGYRQLILWQHRKIRAGNRCVIAIPRELPLMRMCLYRQDILAYPEDADRNKAFRHCGYRQFILWHHGRLGAGNRCVIPSCYVGTIRTKFSDPNSNPVGFVVGLLG